MAQAQRALCLPGEELPDTCQAPRSELVVGGGGVGAEDAGGAGVVEPVRSSLKISFGAGENVKVEEGKMSASKVPLLASVEAVAPAKA